MTNRGSDSPGDGSDRNETDWSGPRQDRTAPDRPAPVADDGSGSVSIEDDGVLRWFLKTNEGPVVYVRDVATSVGLVLLIALVLFGASGVWPPLVAVESGSMEPNMQRGDMILVVDADRFVGDGAIEGTGVVTAETGADTGYSKFANAGDVIIFRPDGSKAKTPVIHRAHFWVDEGENWVETSADPDLTGGQSCAMIAACPAPHDGFVTRGDANPGYDQLRNSGADTTVVKPGWVEGKAAYRIPWLGYIRLVVDDQLSVAGVFVRIGSMTGLVGGIVAVNRRE